MSNQEALAGMFEAIDGYRVNPLYGHWLRCREGGPLVFSVVPGSPSPDFLKILFTCLSQDKG